MKPINAMRLRTPPAAGGVPFSNVKILLFGEGADANTTFTDHSTVGRTLTANGNVQHDTGISVNGQSILFDGNGDYIGAADAADLQIETDFCIEAYVRTTNLSHINTICEKRSEDYWFYITTDGKLNFAVWDSTVVVIVALATTLTVSANTVTHVAVSREGNVWRLFVGGVLDASTTVSGIVGNGASDLRIGGSVTSTRYFEGSMNWFRFTKGSARYTATFTPPSTPFPTS